MYDKLYFLEIDMLRDREYLLDCHCQINYECESSWARQITYECYKQNWLKMDNQINIFLNSIENSINNSKSKAYLIYSDEIFSNVIGYVWAHYSEDKETGFRCLEIQDIYIEAQYRQQGVAKKIILYLEQYAKSIEVKIMRAGTGVLNTSSMKMFESLGYKPYRIEFEKIIDKK